jgi:probable addiction module antidote protein
MPTRDFDPFLRQQLRDPALAAEYLSVSLHEGSTRQFLIALRNVAEARGGMTGLSREADLNRQSLYRALSGNGNPTLSSLLQVLGALGMRLAIEASREAKTG